ncbi:MAG: cell division protein FtsL [Wenzhouxiangella sp.]
MIRWIAFSILMVALLATSIGAVKLRHESRQLFVQLAAAERERDQIAVEWSRLQLEQAWLADASRVERLARERLDMQLPDRISILVAEP